MKKALLVISTLLVGFLFLTACATDSKKEEVYDDKFIQDLKKGLENRWDYTDSSNFQESETSYQTAIDKELSQIEKYSDLKFSDNKLKELAVSYINELNEGKKIAETYGANSFYENWLKHYKTRTEKLNDINNLTPLKFEGKYASNFKALLADGKEVKNQNTADAKVKELVQSIQFTKVDDTNLGDSFFKYETTVENTSGFDLQSVNMVVKLIDETGVVVDQQYIYATDWKQGEQRKFDFMTDKIFAKTEISVQNSFLSDN